MRAESDESQQMPSKRQVDLPDTASFGLFGWRAPWLRCARRTPASRSARSLSPRARCPWGRAPPHRRSGRGDVARSWLPACRMSRSAQSGGRADSGGKTKRGREQASAPADSEARAWKGGCSTDPSGPREVGSAREPFLKGQRQLPPQPALVFRPLPRAVTPGETRQRVPTEGSCV